MWGRKKARPVSVQQVSASRFCREASELPFAELFEFDEFKLAISHLSWFQGWPDFDFADYEPMGLGLVHIRGLSPDGSEHPLLPVELTFQTGPTSTRDGPLGEGWIDRYKDDGERTYVLHVSLRDPGGSIYRAFLRAFEHAALSRSRYLHLICRKSEKLMPLNSADQPFPARYEARRERLKRVEAGHEDLPSVVFDRVVLDDELATAAPDWSWSWRQDLDFRRNVFQSAGARQYRTAMLRSASS